MHAFAIHAFHKMHAGRKDIFKNRLIKFLVVLVWSSQKLFIFPIFLLIDINFSIDIDLEQKNIQLKFCWTENKTPLRFSLISNTIYTDWLIKSKFSNKLSKTKRISFLVAQIHNLLKCFLLLISTCFLSDRSSSAIHSYKNDYFRIAFTFQALEPFLKAMRFMKSNIFSTLGQKNVLFFPEMRVTRRIFTPMAENLYF